MCCQAVPSDQKSVRKRICSRHADQSRMSPTKVPEGFAGGEQRDRHSYERLTKQVTEQRRGTHQHLQWHINKIPRTPVREDCCARAGLSRWLRIVEQCRMSLMWDPSVWSLAANVRPPIMALKAPLSAVFFFGSRGAQEADIP